MCVCVGLHDFVFMFVCVLCRVNKAQSQPRQKRVPVSRPSSDYSEPEDSNGGWSPPAAPPSYSSAGEPVLFIYIRLHKNVIQHRANVLSHSLYCKFNSVFEVARFDLNLISSGSHNLNVNGWYEMRKALNTVCVPSGKVNHAISFIKVANDAFGHTLQLLKNLLKIILTKTKG